MKSLKGVDNFYAVSAAVIAALVSVLLIAGCVTTTGADRREAAILTMEQVEDDIRLLVLELAATNSALASLVNPLQDDITTAYNVYSDGIVTLENASNQFITRADKMEVEGSEYFNEWRIQGETYLNPRIQELSEQRRVELSKIYAEIAASSVGVQSELKEYLSKVKEIKTYFSTDLTAESVSAINEFANRTILDGFNLSVKLRSLLETVTKVRKELSPGKTEAVG